MHLLEKINTGWQTVLLGFLLFLLAAAVYSNSFPGAFIVDDMVIVERNPLVQSLDVKAIFLSDYWGADQNSKLYRPLTIFSLALNRAALGPAPWSFHLVNILLHGGVVFFLFLLLHTWRLHVFISALAAAMFAVHPIHTEVVNIVVGRSELLAALFILLTLFLSASENPWRLTAAAFVFLIALLAKEHAVTLPAMLIGADLFFRHSLKRKLPFYGGLLVIFLAWFFWREYVLDQATAVQTPFYQVYAPLAFMPAKWRVLTALKLQLFYLAKLFWPFGLQGVYSGPAVSTPVRDVISFWGGAGVLAFLAVLAAAIYGWRQRQLYSLAIWFYLISFSVTANLFFPIEVTMAERFAYLPSCWFCLGIAWSIKRLIGRLAGKKNLLPAISFAALLLFLSYGTWIRNPAYRSTEALFSLDLDRDLRNTLAGLYLGDFYLHQGKYREAEQLYQKLLTEQPNILEFREDLAWALLRQKRPQEALRQAQLAVKLRDSEISDKLVMVLGESNLLLGKPDRALYWLDQMGSSNPPLYFWEIRGQAFEALGNLQKAVEAYYQISSFPPGSKVPYRLEHLLLELGKFDEAAKVRQWINSQGDRGKGF